MYFFIINWNLTIIDIYYIVKSVYIIFYTLADCVDLKFKNNLKMLFTWWNKQTLGTFLKTLFTGKYVGKDNLGNKYYKNNKNERWVIYSKKLRQQKSLQIGIYGCIIQLTKFQTKDKKKYSWQKEHAENKTGTKNSYKPIKIKKDTIKKKYETWK